MLGGYGIVGGHIPLAAGVAFASKYRADGRVTLCFFGEGAVSIGGFHEGVSLAALWKLPIVFICENNEYSMGTPLSRTMSVEDVSMKALGYGIDARSLLRRGRARGASSASARPIAARARDCAAHARRGPHLPLPRPLDERSGASTARREELEERKKKDPLLRARARARRTRATARPLETLEAEVEDEVADAVEFADESPEPGPQLLEATTYDGAVRGRSMARSMRYREALREAMIEEMERDDRVFLMGEEVGHYQGAYKVSEGMLEKFGERRVIDTPIAESGFTGHRRSARRWSGSGRSSSS